MTATRPGWPESSDWCRRSQNRPVTLRQRSNGWSARDCKAPWRICSADRDRLRRMVGVAACAMHRVDPGLASGGFLRDGDRTVRSRRATSGGRLGLLEAVPACVQLSPMRTKTCRFGLRGQPCCSVIVIVILDALTRCGLSPGAHRSERFGSCCGCWTRARPMACRSSYPESAGREMVDPGQRHRRRSADVPGSSRGWVIPPAARLAGEAFSTIAGVHLWTGGARSSRTENFESGPNNDPNDPNVEMDPDDGLPWPDAAKIEKWWAVNGSRFTSGTRTPWAPLSRGSVVSRYSGTATSDSELSRRTTCVYCSRATQLFPASASACVPSQRLAGKVELIDCCQVHPGNRLQPYFCSGLDPRCTPKGHIDPEQRRTWLLIAIIFVVMCAWLCIDGLQLTPC